MASIFKYIPEQYVDRFLRGEVLFRSLSYFRDYEEKQVRGDDHEGTRVHKKRKGLEVTKTETNEKFTIPFSFESRAKCEDIIVFCLSTALSSDLASEFGVSTCVEIHRPEVLIAGVRSALKRRPSVRAKTLLHGPIAYYDADTNPIIDWALPDKIAMAKLRRYEAQSEYRIAFALNDAFRVENTKLLLVHHDAVIDRSSLHHREIFLKVGDLRRACTVHRFPSSKFAVAKVA